MKGIIVALGVIAGVAFLIMLLPPMMGGLEGFRTNDQTDAYSVTTGGGVTTANVTLTQPLYQNGTQYASVTSNYSADVPLVTGFQSGTRALEVSGLTAGQSRTLTVVYKILALDANVDTAAGLSPTIFTFGIIGLILIALVGAVMAIMRR